ncbi:hypothetical protein [Singulisphaera sp. PoT]|uniref:hypothetical protein n=1 Tax=Singulisphaera sp. PoT TaxID=3411797 RepID=UPI003BF4DCD5
MFARLQPRLWTLALLVPVLTAGCESSSSSSSGDDVAVAIGNGPSAEAKAKAKPPAGKKGGGAPILPGR